MADTKKTKKSSTKKSSASKTSTTKKTTAKKSTSSKPKTGTKKTVVSSSKKSNVKKSQPAKSTTKKTTTKKVVTKKSAAKNKLPKRIKLESYSCVWRMYLIKNPKTKEEYKKRFWIVIGDGHKRYRKFETQAEAIQYFRALKKFAKMRVQSVKSKQFIRTVYTFYEMIWKGIEIDDIQTSSKSKKVTYSDDEDFEDEFTKFDTKEIDDTEFNEEEINKVLAEAEGDSVVIEEDDYISLQSQDKTDEKKYVTEVLTVNETKKDDESQRRFDLLAEEVEENKQEVDPYALTNEFEYIKEDKKQNEELTIQQNTTSLYDLASNNEEIKEESSTNELAQPTPVHEEKNTYFQPAMSQEEDDMGITQHQTTLTSIDDENNEMNDGKYSKKMKIIYWLCILGLTLSLAAIVVIAILAAGKVI